MGVWFSLLNDFKTREESCHAVPHEETPHIKWFKAIVPPEEVDSSFEVNKVKNL